MVKQGKYAGTSKQKRLRNISHHLQNKGSQNIRREDLINFLLVRWHLTQHGKTKLTNQTTQHFLRTWLQQAEQTNKSVWDVTEITTTTLQLFNTQVPWQFYAVLNSSWTTLQGFLMLEVYNVPLKEPQLVDYSLGIDDWEALVRQQLAVNALLLMFGGNQHSLTNISKQQVDQLSDSFNSDMGINWLAVGKVFEPLTFTMPTTADADSKRWLTSLTKIKPDEIIG